MIHGRRNEKGEGIIVGHILFTPVELLTEDGDSLKLMGLAPMAVVPKLQKKGIGFQNKF